MQYPIIDLITTAYINNGWTGLNIVEGKNLFDESLLVNPTSELKIIILTLKPNTSYIMSTNMVAESGQPALLFFSLPGEPVSTATNGVTFNTPRIVTTTSNGLVQITYRQFSTPISNFNWMLEEGIEVTPYEPYLQPTTDIKQRLKLPLPHYFPHPVIDALQRAAAGTQTADDTEILSHYLTPLGIGGI